MKPTSTTSTARAPRVLDPEILKLRADAKAKVEAYRAAQKSAEILKRITEELVLKLTAADNKTLLESLRAKANAWVTPATGGDAK